MLEVGTSPPVSRLQGVLVTLQTPEQQPSCSPAPPRGFSSTSSLPEPSVHARHGSGPSAFSGGRRCPAAMAREASSPTHWLLTWNICLPLKPTRAVNLISLSTLLECWMLMRTLNSQNFLRAAQERSARAARPLRWPPQ